MRELTQHRTNAANEALTITVLDVPGISGASCMYLIEGFMHDPGTGQNQYPFRQVLLPFQNGPIANGLNGITHEALLAILIDRLKGFQAGPYEHKANQNALNHLEAAMTHLQARTLERQARGVEGTHGL